MCRVGGLMTASCKYCDASRCILTRRAIRGGASQFVYQCMTCGSAVGNAIGKAAVLASEGTLEIQEFDPSIEVQHRQDQHKAYHKERQLEKSKWVVWYDEYLASPEWAAIRAKVLRRSGGQCEGCADREADEIHHLSYEHVGEEFLFELVALCSACHDRVHQGKDDQSKKVNADD